MEKHMVNVAKSVMSRMYAELCQKQADMEHKEQD